MSVLSRLLIVSAATIVLTASAHAETKGPKIAKCQDAQGRWHYGDSAASACAQSKVEVMNSKGMRIKEVAAPPTAAELKTREQERAEAEREKQATEDQKKKDQQLLASYGHEDDIGLARERKTADIKAQMGSIEATLTTLRATLARMQTQAAQEKSGGKSVPQATTDNIAKTESQIAKQEAAMQERQKELEGVRARYDAELARYRQIKGVPAAKAAEVKH